MQSQLLRIPEVARLLGITELAARRMIERGTIPARRFGVRRIVVLRAELEAVFKSLPAVAGGTAKEDAAAQPTRSLDR